MAYLQWPPWPCIHTSRVESSRVDSHESCRVKSLDAACFILQGSGVTEEMDVEKFVLLVKDHETIYDPSRCEHGNGV